MIYSLISPIPTRFQRFRRTVICGLLMCFERFSVMGRLICRILSFPPLDKHPLSHPEDPEDPDPRSAQDRPILNALRSYYDP